MSTKGVYTALSGAMAQSLKMNTIANNIANVNTPGFKRDAQVFQEYLTVNEKPPEIIAIPKDVASIESFYDMQGGDKSFVDAKGTFTEHSQGSLKASGNPLDLAIDGAGFFEVATPAGVRYTRAGNFTMDGTGRLVTKEGHPVLAAGAGDPAAREIRFSGVGHVDISDDGLISEGNNPLARISVVNAGDVHALTKMGNALYAPKPGQNPQITSVVRPSMRQGFVEQSNVNIVQEMTDMIATQRVFESTQKAISAYDSMNDKLVNVVGKTSA